MFKEEYQGGSYVDVFSVTSREPLKEWKVSASGSFDKIYEKEAKGFVLMVKGPPGSTHINVPKDPKKNLFLIQPFFLFQVFVPRLHEFYIELVVRDVRGTRRRLFFSGNQKEISSTALHARLPLSLQQNVWTNLCIDVSSFVQYCWSTSVFHSVASITLAGSFKLRKIFTLKVPPPPLYPPTEKFSDHEFAESSNSCEHLPKNCDFPVDVLHVNQLVSIKTIQKHILSAPPSSVRMNNITSSNTGSLNNGNNAISFSNRTVLSAGDKIPEPPTSSKRRTGVARRVVVSGPCTSATDTERTSQLVSSSKSIDSGHVSSRGLSKDTFKETSKSQLHASSNDSKAELFLVGHKEAILPVIDNDSSSKSEAVANSVADVIDALNFEMDSLQSVKQMISKADNIVANIKSDVPKLPSVRQTFSLVAGEQVESNYLKGNTSSKSEPIDLASKAQGSMTTSSKAEAIAFIESSFKNEDRFSDDDEINLSKLKEQSHAGPSLNSDFHKTDIIQQSPSLYDAKRYMVGEEEDDDNTCKTKANSENHNSELEKTLPLCSSVQTSLTSEPSEVELLFDPVLNCYFDPKTGKYFELIS